MVVSCVAYGCTNRHKGAGSEIEKWNKSQLGQEFQQRGVDFQFNCPKASHWGGVFERMIRSAREHLRHIIDLRTLSDEDLLTLVAEAEFMVNCRPLTSVSDDIDDLLALCPNDLLMVEPMPSLPPGCFDPDQVHFRQSWKRVQSLANGFWRRWTREYLPLLAQRSKWTQQKRNLSVGDLCMLRDEQLPRGQWPLARVIAVHPSPDNLVRSVDIRTKNGVYTRPVQKLSLLESSS